MIIDANDLANNHLHKTSICIIGSGAAGITLAMALANKYQIEVTLLEGSRTGLGNDCVPNPSKYCDHCAQQLYTGKATGLESTSENNLNFLYRNRIRSFGGSTNCWGGWVRPMNAYNFTKRPEINPEGWPLSYEDLLPYYHQVQKDLKLGDFRYNDPEYWVKELDDTEILPITNENMKVVFWQVVSNQMKRFKFTYQPQLTTAPKITIIKNANVLEIETDENATTAQSLRVGIITADSASPDCRASTNEFSVQANQYIVACGGIESIRLLLLSKNLGNRSGLLGRYFFTHPTNRNAARFKLPAHHPFSTPILNSFRNQYIQSTGASWEEQAQVFAALEPTDQYLSKTQSAYWRVRLSVDGLEHVNVNLNFAQIPHYDSRITLDTDVDYFNQPKAKLNYLLNEQDKQTIKNGIDLTRSVLSSMNYVDSWETNWKGPDGWPSDIVWAQHHMGATRMSSDPQKGVLDKNMKLHHVDNVYVCSSSAWPSGDISNPTMTILAFAHRLAEHLFNTNYAKPIA